jgi:SAM-dependent methyltransferase
MKTLNFPLLSLPRTIAGKIFGYGFFRFNLTQRKLSTKNLDRLCREYGTKERTLVIHSEDVEYQHDFPNAYTVTWQPSVPADLHVDVHYRGVAAIPDESYSVILCTGLLEHIPDPQRLLAEFRRILKPGGKLIISASAIFSFHEGPNNFFHFTPHGFRLLFADWSRIEMLRGASQPFETIGILLQRINLQCDIWPPMRVLNEILFRIVPLFDVFIVRQYDSRAFGKNREIDSMLPSNVQAVVIK